MIPSSCENIYIDVSVAIYTNMVGPFDQSMRDRRVLKESASRGAVAEMQAQQPRRR